MENAPLSFPEFGFGDAEAKYNRSYEGWESMEDVSLGVIGAEYKCSDQGLESMEEVSFWKEFNFSGVKDWAPESGFWKEDSSEEEILFSKYQHKEEHNTSFSDCGLLVDHHFNMVTQPFPTCMEENKKFGEFTTLVTDIEAKKEKQRPFSLAKLCLLNNYRNGFKRLQGDRQIKHRNDMPCAKVEGRRVSTVEVMRLAATKFVQSPSQTTDVSILSLPIGFSSSALTRDEIKDVVLAEFLLASAEKAGYQQFEHASKLLNHCNQWCSNTGNPVQRVVYYFSEALQEKIERETGGGIKSDDLGKSKFVDIDEAMTTMTSNMLACHKEMPFSSVAHFSGVQAIVESMNEARKIHIIDLAIQTGIQWTVLMQALATRNQCPLELLKITAVGTTSKDVIQHTGKRLASFAQSMNLSFSFKVVMVSDTRDLKKNHFELNSDERVSVYSEYFLRSMISHSSRLESMMKVIKSIKPSIMVVTEVEANHNSPSFVSRFTEALFYFSAYFDCLETFMSPSDPHRMITESLFCREAIRSIVAAEGEERRIRTVKIDVWRSFFSRYKMKEKELSMSSRFQASLIIERFNCEDFCTLAKNGNCLIVRWKGTPIFSLSAWKFV